MTTLMQLLKPKTAAEIRAQALRALQGVTHVTHRGRGAGSVLVEGIPRDSAQVVLAISNSGPAGVGKYRLSTDGGKTYADEALIGQLALPQGVTVSWVPGGAGQEHFVADDTYSFGLSPPTLSVTSWQAGSTPRTLVDVDCLALEDLWQLVGNLGAGGFLESATDDWLDLYAENVYGLERIKATRAVGVVVLEDVADVGPIPITPASIWVQSDSGRLFYSTGNATLPQGGEVVIEVVAEQAGASHNVGNGTIHTLVTSFPGVVVSNPDPGTGSWLTKAATDRESDDDYRARCRAQWGALGIGATAVSYERWARDAVKLAGKNFGRIKVGPDPLVPGKVKMVLAGAAGPAGADVVSVVSDYIEERLPLGLGFEVVDASIQAVTITAAGYVRPGMVSTVNAQATAALDAVVAALPIGGALTRSAIIDALVVPGVWKLLLPTPSAEETQAGADGIITYTLNLTWVEQLPPGESS